MTALTIAQALLLSKPLEQISDTPELDLQLLLQGVLDKPRSYLYTWPERELSESQRQQFQDWLQRRQNGEPIAHILGQRDFWTLTLAVNPTTLIPRPDTERLVEVALELLADGPHKVADLGTGTGAIALALSSERPKWQLYATDRVAEAVDLARRNRDQLGLTRVEVFQGSWCQPLIEQGLTSMDMIVSNPPYIDPQDKHLGEGDVRFEPRSALVADNSGMADIEAISEQALACLKPGGWLVFEHGYDQRESVQACLSQRGYSNIKTFVDLGDNDRVSVGQWLPAANAE
ncbi:MAG: peptide chain release factor N(5)-glutamine methyltransferase [Motiliproteus sp.]|nr:peptide chain release factor N(5)-glutamine methyltransferase [Motiliproteus sp.]MCW9051211.1 peptide chain release factor N(5)-glutamine methyltransferase [Motiliproteus sp.]